MLKLEDPNIFLWKARKSSKKEIYENSRLHLLGL
jgi:hypothetical protein